MNNLNSNDNTFYQRIEIVKTLGRKRRNKTPNKYSYDNLIIKIKYFLIKTILNFVNNSLQEEQIGTRKLVNINQNIIRNIKRDSTLKEIFSSDISSKFKKLDKNYNKKIIEEIYLSSNKEKIINILNMTLSQCINHLIKKEYYPELKGLENEYENIINQLKKSGETDENNELFKGLFNRFEEFLKKKKTYCQKEEENNRDNK